jgi:hypothetical protein
VLALCVNASARAQSVGGETAASETWAKAAAASTPSAPVAIRLSGLSASGEPANLADTEPPTSEDSSPSFAPVAPLPPASAPPNPEFLTVAGASNLVASPAGSDAQPGGAVEIPPASSNQAAPQASPSAAGAAQIRSDQQTERDDTARYQADPDGMPPPRQYMPTQSAGDDTVFSTPFGIDLAEARRTLKSGEELDGLLIVNVRKGSPAAAAGLHGYAHGMHDAITSAAMVGAMAGAMFAPVAALAVPLIQAIPFGESYDLIIGVDGSRVTNYLDFTHRTRDILAGELIYLSVVRDGQRIQVTLTVPADLTARGD